MLLFAGCCSLQIHAHAHTYVHLRAHQIETLTIVIAYIICVCMDKLRRKFRWWIGKSLLLLCNECDGGSGLKKSRHTNVDSSMHKVGLQHELASLDDLYARIKNLQIYALMHKVRWTLMIAYKLVENTLNAAASYCVQVEGHITASLNVYQSHLCEFSSTCTLMNVATHVQRLL